MVRPSQRKEMAQRAVTENRVSIRVACLAFAISESCYRYTAKLSDENAEIADWLIRFTNNQKMRISRMRNIAIIQRRLKRERQRTTSLESE